jgi:hypothetical protein
MSDLLTNTERQDHFQLRRAESALKPFTSVSRYQQITSRSVENTLFRHVQQSIAIAGRHAARSTMPRRVRAVLAYSPARRQLREWRMLPRRPVLLHIW